MRLVSKPRPVAEPLADRDRLTEIVHSFHKRKALVCGDAMQDAYIHGHVDRVSPEAPVMVFVPGWSEVRRGGADNVAHQLEELGLEIIPFFSPTPSVKTRYMVGHHQVFRVDRDSATSAQSMDRKAALELLDQDIAVVVLSDYAKGWVTTDLCGCLISAATELKIPTVVDPKVSDWTRYRGATLMCPNHLEYAGHEKLVFPYLWLKKGAQGIEVFERGVSKQTVHATAVHVSDVTGAGDIVTALAAAGASVGAGSIDSARLAALAAGFAVGQVGTSVCSKDTLLKLIQESS